MLDTRTIIEALICFAAGSIPFAVIAMWGSGIDIRQVGSGNPGFNNVLRVDKKRAVVALAGDVLKGFAPLWFFYDPAQDPSYQGWLYAFAAVFGHCYSPFLRFNGGKGIAASAGVMLRLYPHWAALGLAFFVAVRLLGGSRKLREAGALASLATWGFFTLMMHLYEDGFATRNAALMTLFLAWRHKANVRRMFS